MVEFEIVADAGVTEVLTAREWAEVVKMRKHYYKLTKKGQRVKLEHDDVEYGETKPIWCLHHKVSSESEELSDVGRSIDDKRIFIFPWCCPEELNLEAGDYDDNGNVTSYTRHPSDPVKIGDYVELPRGERFELRELACSGDEFTVEHGQICMFQFIGHRRNYA